MDEKHILRRRKTWNSRARGSEPPPPTPLTHIVLGCRILDSSPEGVKIPGPKNTFQLFISWLVSIIASEMHVAPRIFSMAVVVV